MPTTKFLFWNLNRKPLAPLIAEIARSHNVDVIILVESGNSPGEVLTALNADSARFHLPLGLSRHILMFTAFSRDCMSPVLESDRISIRVLKLPAREPVLLAAVHVPSKLHWSDQSQSFECGELARDIETEEQKAGHRRTILVGDFNMNPFEPGMISAAGLHAVMSRRVASRGCRQVQGREYQFFYNPMWCHLGDAKTDTAGTYYFDSAQHVTFFWNVFDQVLLRPELASRFDPASISILQKAGDLSLVRPNGRPDRAVGSDHLPLVFEVEF